MTENILDLLEASPVIAAVREEDLEKAVRSPAEVIFLLGASVLHAGEEIRKVHEAGKKIFIHIDLSEGIGKDRHGIEFLARLGADGILSTKSAMIRFAKEFGMIAVQRFFAYDSQGVNGIGEILSTGHPDVMEIMPGVIGKVIRRFAGGRIPLIVGGLVETKSEITAALELGAVAISTGKEELWYL